MSKNYYKKEETIQELSQFGDVFFNEDSGVVRVSPKYEEHTEYHLDESVKEGTPLDEIPPHLKHVVPLFFFNRDSIYPENKMICCVAPGRLQQFVTKAWVDIQYLDNWKNYEDIVQNSSCIKYPFVVTTYDSISPKTVQLMENSKMNLFKTLLTGNNRRVSVNEFESVWIHLFNAKNIYNHDANGEDIAPLSAWLSVAETPAAYVDVYQVNSDKTETILFTVPPLMSFNNQESSIMRPDATTNYLNMAKRAEEHSNRIPKSGNAEIERGLGGVVAESEIIDKHQEMWRIIEKRYNMYIITSPDNDLNEETNKKVVVHDIDKYDDEMVEI